ncbi:non-canonical purine NTP pyrophosphatase, partial [Bacillus safensis]|nr:non-canonical purine NTP pyrophosphatase [Bacillus safensis]
MIRMKTAIIATHNAGKAKEFKAILEPKGFTVKK